MSGRKSIILLALLAAVHGFGCGGSSGGGGGGGGGAGGGDASTSTIQSAICGTDAPPISCETLRDCPPSGIDCVIGVCQDAFCKWVNLATVDVLPTDPESGLPLGKGCREDCGN